MSMGAGGGKPSSLCDAVCVAELVSLHSSTPSAFHEAGGASDAAFKFPASNVGPADFDPWQLERTHERVDPAVQHYRTRSIGFG